MKKLFIIICLLLCTSSSYAYDSSGRWTGSDVDNMYNQRIENERMQRIEDYMRQNSDHRTYRNERY